MTQPFSSELAAEILQEIKGAKNILMHCHPNPDGDSMGSTLGMKYVLKTLGIESTIIRGDTDLPKYLSVLLGYETIVKKNIFEVDLSQYDLFLILDSGSLNQISKIKDPEFPSTLKTIVIDHHVSNTGYADINLVDSSYPSTCQIVVDLITSWNIAFTRDMALNLFVGMFTDTGGFRYHSTTHKTFLAAAKLAEVAPDFPEIMFQIENNNTKGRLKLHGYLLNSIETFFNDSVAFASISYDDIQKHGFTKDEISGAYITNEMKSVVGWNVCAYLMEIEPGIVKMSFRTRDEKAFDVSKLAVELGGGGHVRAAGAQIRGTLSEVKENVLETMKRVYNL
ncbi:MAG: bifunctional oligoribonuclease/PAP phosphatase NrnA [bacterium]|nr:bifunctional oligoribonuclease/PAP phosphatase NrnA [bacterium]